MGFANSIATLVLHIYGTEAGIAHRLAGETMSDELKAEFLLNLPQRPLPAATGETAESLLAKLNKGRSILMERLGQITEADLDRELPLGLERTATVRWLLTLLSAHQSIHAGQILLLKKLV